MKKQHQFPYAAPVIETIDIAAEQGFSLSAGEYPGGDVEVNPFSFSEEESFF